MNVDAIETAQPLKPRPPPGPGPSKQDRAGDLLQHQLLASYRDRAALEMNIMGRRLQAQDAMIA